MSVAADAERRERLRTEMAALNQAQAERFRAGAGAGVPELVRERAAAYDGWLCGLWQEIVGNAPLALFAVGGYGRGELYPYSDIDVLVFALEAPDATMRERIESFVAALWDLNLRPGHAVRTARECTEAAAGDLTVFTALMEARPLCGAPVAQAQLAAALDDPAVWPAPAYLSGKLGEIAARHARFGDTSYNLEPNLKDGPGGLRDIQTAAWIAQRLAGSAAPRDWLDRGVVLAHEQHDLDAARATLQRLRFGLHVVAERAEDRLLFDHQPTLAALLGYADRGRDNRAVEQMMQGFFRAALDVRRTLARMTARWREQDEDALPPVDLGDGFIRRGTRLARAQDAGHALREAGSDAAGASEVTGRERDGGSDAAGASEVTGCARDAAWLLQLFRCWQQHPDIDGLSAATDEAVQAALAANETPLHASAPARDAFLDILRGPRVAETLSRMHLHGVLGRYLPEFAGVTGRMQYDLFHVFTVDQHTLNVIRNIDRMADGEAPEFPQAGAIFEGLRRPELLYLAALFHDIAKGRGGDHAEVGAVDAEAFCRVHGLRASDTDIVAWLVREHLLLSVTAQKSDITDPAVINAFAARVADRERLDMLYLLTMADIAGTSPALWNAWKARLVADLFAAARFALRRGLEHPIHADERVAECRRAALALLADDGIDAEAAESIWTDFPPASFLRYRPGLIAWVTRNVAQARADVLPLVAARGEGTRGAREIFVHSEDVDGLFAAVTSALDRLDLDVVEARVLTSGKGLSLDTFRVLERTRRLDPSLDAAERERLESARNEEIVRSLRYALRQRPLRHGPVRRSLSRTQRHFRMASQIEFAAASTPARTRMTLVCSDRPGLLALVAQVLRECRIRVHGARIATFGERAEDFFLVSDESDQALDESLQQHVAQALHRRLDTDETPDAVASGR
jgi:[protein-PII] uridylyltransferase